MLKKELSLKKDLKNCKRQLIFGIMKGIALYAAAKIVLKKLR